MNLNKVIRNGKTAVLYSPGFGAGWYTWNRGYPLLMFDPILVDMVENNIVKAITHKFVIELLKTHGIANPDVYISKDLKLQIEWVPVGSEFEIREYLGNERVEVFYKNKNLFIA